MRINFIVSPLVTYFLIRIGDFGQDKQGCDLAHDPDNNFGKNKYDDKHRE